MSSCPALFILVRGFFILVRERKKGRERERENGEGEGMGGESHFRVFVVVDSLFSVF